MGYMIRGIEEGLKKMLKKQEEEEKKKEKEELKKLKQSDPCDILPEESSI